jgi:hypothetical protein
VIRVEIQNHDIAAFGRQEVVHPFLIRLQQDLELLPKDGRKKWAKRAVFRIKSDLDHEWATSLTMHSHAASRGEAGNLLP